MLSDWSFCYCHLFLPTYHVFDFEFWLINFRLIMPQLYFVSIHASLSLQSILLSKLFLIYIWKLFFKMKNLYLVLILEGADERHMKVRGNGKQVGKRKLFFITVSIQVYVGAVFIMYPKTRFFFPPQWGLLFIEFWTSGGLCMKKKGEVRNGWKAVGEKKYSSHVLGVYISMDNIPFFLGRN